MRVRELMTPASSLVTVRRDATAADVVRLLMARGIGAVPVVDHDQRPVGIVAERDIVMALEARKGAVMETPVAAVMRTPAPGCDVNDRVLEVMTRMTRDRTRHLVVCEEGRMVGVVSVGDVVKHRLSQLETEAGVLRDYVAGQRARV